jgi:adenylate cyclase
MADYSEESFRRALALLTRSNTPTPTNGSLPLPLATTLFPLKRTIAVKPIIPTPKSLFPLKKSQSLEDLLKECSMRIDSILGMELKVTAAREVPKTEQVAFSEGRLLETAVLFIDMRGSTALSQERYKITISKIYKAFFDVVGKVISWKHGAHIRGFAGDRLMAVFTPGDKSCDSAVDAAIILQTVITKVLNPKLNRKYNATIDFGIGIDYGEMMATRVGIYGGGSNSDLVWSGNAANYASKLADFQGTSAIRITTAAHSKLTSHLKSVSGSDLWPNKYSLDVGSKKIVYYCDEGTYKITADDLKI